MSSQPDNAQIFLDGKLYKSNTNARLQLEAGQYTAKIQKEGYRPWQRILSVDGGSVRHYDYPLLIPSKLTTANLKSYNTAPGFASQSPDRRWLVVQQNTSPLNFDLYDLSDPLEVTARLKTFSLPDAVLTSPSAGEHSLQLIEWSTDNRHILVKHVVGETNEYITVDTREPTLSLNLTRALSLTPTKVLTLHDKKFDKFYVYDSTARTLDTTTVSNAGKTSPLLDQIISYKTYGSDIVLYITDKAAPAGKVMAALMDGSETYKIRDLVPTGPYLIDISQYDRKWYVAVGASSENRVYVYQNPQQVRRSSVTAALVPVQVLKVATPNYLAFSSNTEFIATQNGTNFADYDAETDKGYNFISKYPLDPPAVHGTWMDGHRLSYVSGGKLVIFDYDNINAQAIVPASPNYLAMFNRNYGYVYTFVSSVNADGQPATTLTGTSLRIPADQ